VAPPIVEHVSHAATFKKIPSIGFLVHVADERLASFIDVNVLDADEL
jgi:hypothetical protein